MIDLGFMMILRPWALLLAIPVAWFLWWMSRHQDERRRWARLVAPRFLPWLLVSQNAAASRLAPYWFIGAVLGLMVIVLSGPSWQEKPSPFKKSSAEIAFVLKNTPGMQAKDLPPTRLTRAVFKIDDLLKLRPKLRSALVVYSGSAHLALPLTRDGAIIASFAAALDPSVMPVIGDVLPAAVKLAARALGRGGTLIILADTITRAQVDAIAADKSLQDVKLLFFATLPPAMADKALYRYAADKLDADVVYFSADDHDVHRISAAISHNFEHLSNKADDRKDDGYGFLFPLALILLFWFRRGFLAESWRVS